MPKGFQKGHAKIAGRVKGSPVSLEQRKVREILQRLGHCPFEGMVRLAENSVTCGVCRGNPEDPSTCKTRCKLKLEVACQCIAMDDADSEEDKTADPDCWRCSGTGMATLGLRTCQSCYGTGMEAISPELRGKMEAELGAYVQAKLKHVEHANDKDNPLIQGYRAEEWKPPGLRSSDMERKK